MVQRKVSSIVEELCGKSVSKSFVSNLTKSLDEEVRIFQYSNLETTQYPYVITDVMYIKVRENKRVVSKSFHIALGINEEGHREVLGFMIQETESEASWRNFFEYLKKRGLNGVKMIISDAHSGLVKAVEKEFTGVSWQRCQLHFLRNILDATPKKDSKVFREKVKSIFRLTDIDSARQAKNSLIEEYQDDSLYQKACVILDEGFEDSFQYVVNMD